MMNCNQVSDLISQYIDGEVSPRQASEIQAHILSCRSCADALEKLIKAVDTLESLSPEEENVDIYTGFLKKQAAQPRTRRFELPTLAPRRWAMVGIAVALTLIGSIGGSLLKGNRTLYVSNPRSEYSAIYSSVAIAAEKAQDRPGVDAPLLADSRLSKVVDITARGETLGRVLETLSKRSKVQISAAPDLARQRVYLRLQDMRISAVMAEVRKLSDSDWKITEGSNGRSYELICSERVKKMAAAVAEAQAMTHAEKALRALQEAIETRNPKPIANEVIYHGYGIENELKKLSKDPKHRISHHCAHFFLIDDEVVSTIMVGQKYRISYNDMSEKQKKYFRMSNHAFYNSDKPEEYTLTIWMEYRDAGNVILNMSAANEWCSTGAVLDLYSPITHNYQNSLSKEDISALHETESAGNSGYDDPRLQVSMDNDIYVRPNEQAYEVPDEPAYTQPEMLDLIAKRTNLRIVSDHFSVNAKRGTVFASELTLGELLAVLEQKHGVAWYLTPDNTLRLVHRQWPVLQETEPDMELVAQLNDHIRKQGKLTMDQIAPLANLSKLQLQGLTSQLENHPVPSNLFSIMSGGFKPTWKLYLSLTLEQKRLAKSRQGLPSSMLCSAQKRMAYEAAHGSVSGMTPERLKAKYTFSVFEGKAKRKDIKAIADKIGSSMYHGGPPRDVEEYIYFRFAGEYEHLDAFSLPSVR